MLRQRVLFVIAENPGITAAELRAQLPDVERRVLKAAIEALLRSREIERAAYGRYRAISRRPSVNAAQFVRGQPLARLMAGR
jgi:hypothetical protein